MECEYYNVVDIASILGISRTSAYKMFALEDFPCVKIGNRSLIKKDKFDAYMEEHLKSTIYITPWIMVKAVVTTIERVQKITENRHFDVWWRIILGR